MWKRCKEILPSGHWKGKWGASLFSFSFFPRCFFLSFFFFPLRLSSLPLCTMCSERVRVPLVKRLRDAKEFTVPSDKQFVLALLTCFCDLAGWKVAQACSDPSSSLFTLCSDKKFRSPSPIPALNCVAGTRDGGIQEHGSQPWFFRNPEKGPLGLGGFPWGKAQNGKMRRKAFFFGPRLY